MWDPFFSSDTPAIPFVLFGRAHLLTIAALAVLGFLVIRAGRAGGEGTRRRFRAGMIAVLVLLYFETHFWHAHHGLWVIRERLPLHMCGAMEWVTVYGLWSKRSWTWPLMYFFGIAGAIQAVLTPDSAYGLPHVRFLNTMLSHSTLVVAGFWVVAVEGYRPTLRSTLRALAIVNVYAAVVFPFNVLAGTNYLYVVAKPETPSLMDIFPAWPWYLLILEGLVILIVVGMYLPFARLCEALSRGTLVSILKPGGPL